MQIEDFQKELETRAQEDAENQKMDMVISLLSEIRDLLKTDNKNDEKTQAESDKLGT